MEDEVEGEEDEGKRRDWLKRPTFVHVVGDCEWWMWSRGGAWE